MTDRRSLSDGGAGCFPFTTDRGIALVTVMLLLMIMTMVGILSITVTGLGNRMAWYGRAGESGAGAAESCVQTAAKIIQQTMDNGALPATVLDSATPAGPVPASNSATLQGEIMGQSNNNGDTPASAPNTLLTINNFNVAGDIDRLYAKPKAGSGMQFGSGYEGTGGGAAAGGVDVYYRIDCVATSPATNTATEIVAIYACTVTGETCQRKI